MNVKPPPHSRSYLPSPPPHSPRQTQMSPSPQPHHNTLPALPFHPQPQPLPVSSNSLTHYTSPTHPPPIYNTYHPFPILSCADLPPPTFSSNYQSPPTFKAEFRAPFFGLPQQQHHHHQGPNPHSTAVSIHNFHTQYQNGGNWGVVEGGRLAGDAFVSPHEAPEGVGMGGGCGWWSRKIVYYSGGGQQEQEQDQWQSPTPPGSPGPGSV